MRIAFVLNDLRLSGGVNVVLQYASRMASCGKYEVSLLLRSSSSQSWSNEFTQNIKIVPRESWPLAEFDVAIATYWETILLLGQVKASSYIWFCQLYEDRFFPDRNPNISSMQIAGAIPLPVITEAHWLKDLISSENPDRAVEVVLNGIDKATFKKSPRDQRPEKGFHVLVEGSLDAIAKNTEMAIVGSLSSHEATLVTHVGNRPFLTKDPRYRYVESQLSFDHMSAMYSRHHLLVKTPLAEGMFGPPLEAFHCGTPALVTSVTGAEEYIQDGVNSIQVSWSDTLEIGRWIDELSRNRPLWKKLSKGAIATAKTWPDWNTQTHKFEKAIDKVRPTSKLTQADLGNLARTIQFSDLMHWLAMRRLSDKHAGPAAMEKIMATHPPRGQSVFLARITSFLRRLRIMK